MIILIKNGGLPDNLTGPPLPFVWLGNLTVKARKKGEKFTVPLRQIIKKLRRKDYPHGARFAHFFSECKTKKLIFSSGSVETISGQHQGR